MIQMRTDIILTWLAGLMLVLCILDDKPLDVVMLWALALVIVGTLAVAARYAMNTYGRTRKPMVILQPRCNSEDWRTK